MIDKNRRKYYRNYQRLYSLSICGKKKISAKNKLQKIKLSENDICFYCNSSKNLIKHHYNYEKPLNYIILCSKCHRLFHSEISNANKEYYCISSLLEKQILKNVIGAF